VLRLVSLPVWHGLSPGRLQLELAAQPPLAKRWKALLKKEAKAAKAAAAAAAAKQQGDGEPAAAAAAELPHAEAVFIAGILQEFLSCLRSADTALAGEYQQQQGGGGRLAVSAVAAAAVAAVGPADESEDESEEEEEQQQPAAAAAAAEGGGGGEDAAATEAAAANGHAAANGRKRGRAAAGADFRSSGPRRLPRRLLLHLERCVEFFVDLLSQLPTRRFVHALV
jgi:hypothetical protein